MKLKNYTAIILTGVIGTIVILLGAWAMHAIQTAANTDKSGENKPTPIKFYYTYAENEVGAKSMRNLISYFNSAQDRIKVEGYDGVSVDEQLVAIMSGNAPDVGYTYWPDAIRWRQNGALEPLTPYIQFSHYNIDDFLPATLNIVKYNNDIYAIPFYVQTMALYYNKDLLKKAGYDQPPETMEEFKVLAKKLTKVNKDGEIESMGFLPDYPWVDNVLWPILFGAQFYDKSKNEITTTSNEYISAIEFENWFYKEWGWDQISKFKLKFGDDEQDPFYTGKLAMVMGGDWVARDIQHYAPNLNYGSCSFPYPAGRPDLKDSSMISPTVIYMPSTSSHKSEAWQFISFLTSTESMLKYGKEYKCLMARKSAIEDPEIKNDQWLKLLANFALNKNTRSFEPLPIVDEYLADLSEQTTLVFKQKKTANEAMTYVKTQIDPLLKDKE